MTWNEDRERLIAAAELGDATPQIAADLLVAARKRAFEAESAHAWIKTSERMPEPELAVLIVSTEHLQSGGVCTAKCYVTVIGTLIWEHYDPATGEAGDDIMATNVTYWQPLPEPPK